MENENIVSVILYDTTRFTIGNKYRFCLVLVQKKDDQSDLVVGCSNITKLKQIENMLPTDKLSEQFSTPVSITTKEFVEKAPSTPEPEVISDISSFEKITELMQNDRRQVHDDDNAQEYTTKYQSEVNHVLTIPSTLKPKSSTADQAYASQLMNHFNDTFMPSLSIGVLITSICAFIWAATKITHHRRAIPSTVCYAANQHSVDIENSNRYLKLQATTTLWPTESVSDKLNLLTSWCIAMSLPKMWYNWLVHRWNVPLKELLHSLIDEIILNNLYEILCYWRLCM